MPNLQLNWLGPPVIEYDGRPLQLEMRKTLALLAYLSCTPQNPTRETLATLFWPEYDQQHAMASLRRNLSSLAGSLPIGILNISREAIGMQKADWLNIDADEFIKQIVYTNQHSHPAPTICEDCLSSLEKAVTLYRGNFLEGFSLKDCPEFDEWQYFQREDLLTKYSCAIDRLIGYYASLRIWEKALSHARSWVKVDRISEPARRRLIYLLNQSGQPLAAWRQAEELMRILRDELSQNPEEETLELFERVNIDSQASKKAGPVSKIVETPQRHGLEPLLKTKLYIPFSKGKNVFRRQVLSRLNGIEDHKITIVSAPAGYGKTTALSEWIKQSQLAVGWLSLDSADNNPFRFLTYLIAASQEFGAEIGEDALKLVQFSQELDTQAIITSLIYDFEKVAIQFILVLDDYHVIHEIQVQEVLESLIDRLPSQAHLVILTRIDLPLNLARLRAQGKLLEIRVQDLRFTPDETMILFNDILGINLSPNDTDLLNGRTEGWAVGLQMAALSLQKSLDKSKAIQAFSGSNRYILDYLLEEVIESQPDCVHDFLLQTSILDQMCGSLCDAVTRIMEWRADSKKSKSLINLPCSSQQMLEYLERSNLFVQALDDERCWYRYHHLFAELLQARLAHVRPDLFEGLHLLASEWYEQNEYIPAAVKHALLSKNFHHAAGVIERAVKTSTIWGSGDLAQLLSWVDGLPKNVLILHPMLRLYLSSAFYVTGDFSKSIQIIEEVEKSLPEILNKISDPIMVEQIHLSFRVLFEATEGNISSAINYYSKLQTIESDDEFIKFFGRNYLLLAYLIAGDVQNALQTASASVEAFISHGFALQALSNAQNLAEVYILQGRLTDAIELCQLTAERCKLMGVSSPVAGITGLAIGKVLLERNELEQAEDTLQKSLELLSHGPLRYDFGQGYALLAMVKQAQGDRKQAAEFINRALHSAEFANIPRMVHLIQAYQARIWLAQGETNLASDWAQVYQQLGPSEYPREFEDLTLARVMITQNQYNEALDFLDQLLSKSHSAKREGRVLEIHAFLSVVYLLKNQINEAIVFLKESLRTASREGYVRIYLELGNPMHELLELYKGKHHKEFSEPLSEYIDRLLLTFEP